MDVTAGIKGPNRGGFTPGFTGLDSAAQIIAYSVLFGYGQQLFTSFVDRQANSILAGSPNVGPALAPGTVPPLAEKTSVAPPARPDDARPAIN